MGMKILVTGGAGFIGSNFIRYILKNYIDYEIVNLDKLTYAGNLENLRDIENDPRYSFIKGDICDKDVVNSLVKGVEAIINFAAETHVDRSILHPGEFIKTDVYGTYVLLEAVKANNIPRYIQISTDEVYGSIEEGSFKETDPLNPSSPYSASKAGADLLVLSYRVTYGLPVIITRSSNNFGSYQYPEKFIPLFITNALEDRELPLYGDGKNIRDWIYVIDNCKAIDIILHRGVAGEIYNIGGGSEIDNITITRKILQITARSESLIKMVKDRPGHDRRYSLNCDKIKKLGWHPEYEFDAALEETVKWYRNNEKWWKEIKERQKEFREFYARQYRG